jgi:predicted MFS family arabinose efflux permease
MNAISNSKKEISIDVGLSLGSLALLAACNFIVGSGAMSLTGLIAIVALDLQVSTSSAAQLLTAYALAFAISAPLVALLAAKICRKKLLVLALTAFGLFTIASTLVTDFATLWLLRAAAGAAAAAFVPNASAVAAALAAPAQRGRALAVVFGGFTAALVLGAPLGTYAGQTFGWRWTFAAMGSAALLLALITRLRLPGGIMVPGATSAVFKAALLQWRLLFMLGINAISALGTFILFGLASFAFPKLLSAPNAALSIALLVFGLGSLLGNIVSMFAVDRFGAVSLSTVALILSAIAMALLATEFSPWLGWAALILWGCASFVASTAMHARLVSAKPELTSALLPLNSSSQFIGQSLGVIAGGAWILHHQDSAQGLAWIGCLAMIIAALSSAMLGRRTRAAASNLNLK